MTSEPTIVARTRDALREVIDPELGMDVVSLGLVYDIHLENGSVVIDMTLTTPGCPVSESLPLEAQDAATAVTMLHGFGEARVDVVWDPPWCPDMIEEEVARELGLRA